MMKKLPFITFLLLSLIMFPVMAFADNNTAIVRTPEPTTLLLIVSGLIGVLGLRRVFKK